MGPVVEEVKWIKKPIKKGLKRNFCLVSVIVGITVYLSKFAKKAAPFATACLVAAMPFAGIGGVNVASAQEDNSSQYREINLPEIQGMKDTYTVGLYIESNIILTPEVCNNKSISKSCWQDSIYGKTSMGKIGEREMSYYKTLAKLLQKSNEEISNPSSSYSPVYNEDMFNKYLDSIVSDAQRAGETGVESLIPSPEGQVLDTISHGTYGQVSQINTIAQMGWYMQNMSKNAGKMLEETRKSPERTAEFSKSIDYSFDRKIDDVMSNFRSYYLINYGFEPTDSAVGLVKSFDDDIKEIWKTHPRYVHEYCNPLFGYSAFGINKIPQYDVDNFLLNTYADLYGYSLPPSLDFVEIPITEEEKQDILEIRKIIEKNKEIEKNLPENRYSKELGETLDRADYWYNHIAFKPNTLIVSSVMGRKIKGYTPKEFQDYINYLKEWSIEKPKEDRIKIKNLKTDIDKNYGFLTRKFSDNYKESSEILDNIKNFLESNEGSLIEDFPIDEGCNYYGKICPMIDKVLELKPNMNKEQKGAVYGILHSIETFGRKDTQDIFTNPIIIEIRNKAIEEDIVRGLKRGDIELDEKESDELGIPVYEINKGNIKVYYFDNFKKEKIKAPIKFAHGDTYSIHSIDQNTNLLVTNKGYKVYIDKEDIAYGVL